MDNPNYEESQGGAPSTQNPPPYSEKEQQLPIDGAASPMGFVGNAAMPQQYQPYYGPYNAACFQGPVTQPLQHTTVVVSVQPTHEPDCLAYSIFTMLCCCLPLGIAALVYSIQTRDANHIGDAVAARQSSKMAQIFAHTALCVGLMIIILYIVLKVVGV